MKEFHQEFHATEFAWSLEPCFWQLIIPQMKATVLALKISTRLLTTFFFSQFDHFGDRSRCITFIFPQLMRLKWWADSHPLYTSKETLIKMSQFFFFFNLKLKRVCLSGCYWSPFFLQSFFCIQIKRRLSITFRSCFVFVQLALKKKKKEAVQWDVKWSSNYCRFSSRICPYFWIHLMSTF